jgi:hypothetical protein
VILPVKTDDRLMTISAIDLAHQFFGSKFILSLSLIERERATGGEKMSFDLVDEFPRFGRSHSDFQITP